MAVAAGGGAGGAGLGGGEGGGGGSVADPGFEFLFVDKQLDQRETARRSELRGRAAAQLQERAKAQQERLHSDAPLLAVQLRGAEQQLRAAGEQREVLGRDNAQLRAEIAALRHAAAERARAEAARAAGAATVAAARREAEARVAALEGAMAEVRGAVLRGALPRLEEARRTLEELQGAVEGAVGAAGGGYADTDGGGGGGGFSMEGVVASALAAASLESDVFSGAWGSADGLDEFKEVARLERGTGELGAQVVALKVAVERLCEVAGPASPAGRGGGGRARFDRRASSGGGAASGACGLLKCLFARCKPKTYAKLAVTTKDPYTVI